MATQQKEIEVDPVFLEKPEEEAYDSCAGYDTSTASLTSSINEFVYQHGRRYHTYYGDDKNYLPVDETEQDRLDLHHEVFLGLLEQDLHKAPIGSNPQKILDVGTGTGIWAVDIAEKYPSAEIIGTDLTPIQPAWVPPNCKFEIDDAEQEWTYASNSFDLIHMRNLIQGIRDWDKVLKDAYRCTKPGGWIELQEISGHLRCDDGTMKDDNPIKVFLDNLAKAMEKSGRPPAANGEQMKKDLEKAGFVDVQIHIARQPLGPWPKEPRLKQIGAMMLLSSETMFSAYGMVPFTRILGMSEEEARNMCETAKRGVKNKNYHTYSHFYVVYGRKPE
ncbi:S-adenosyl-L-methionine-dependent methyltransferase [Pyronema omphalodes]|nr:S-adenosyl-L-methionine-dependent methyltransferase [Pyronema omphalodes]